jgi:hypothetical protein
MSQHQTFKRTAEGKATTRNRRSIRAVKYATGPADLSYLIGA